jgi:hypothetical protein
MGHCLGMGVSAACIKSSLMMEVGDAMTWVTSCRELYSSVNSISPDDVGDSLAQFENAA